MHKAVIVKFDVICQIKINFANIPLAKAHVLGETPPGGIPSLHTYSPSVHVVNPPPISVLCDIAVCQPASKPDHHPLTPTHDSLLQHLH